MTELVVEDALDILKGRVDTDDVQVLTLEKRDDEKYKGMWYMSIKDGGKIKNRSLKTKDKELATKRFNKAKELYGGGQETTSKPEPEPSYSHMTELLVEEEVKAEETKPAQEEPTMLDKLSATLMPWKNKQSKEVEPKQSKIEQSEEVFVVRNGEDIVTVISGAGEAQAKAMAFDEMGFKLDELTESERKLLSLVQKG